MIVIDWISTYNHRNFNRAFFSAVGDDKFECFVFTEKLVVPEINCTLIASSENRFVRFCDVFKLILCNKKTPILLLTYDHLFLPFILLFVREIVVFEHNTVPERHSWAKAIWQKFTLRKVLRLTQFRGQFDRLKELSLNPFHVGSPLQHIIGWNLKYTVKAGYYMAPTLKGEVSEILNHSEFFNKKRISVKSHVRWGRKDFTIEGIRFLVSDRLDIDGVEQNVKGLIISTNSNIRGSGWFNEAISRNIPIIPLNHESEIMFQETFPNYPFISAKYLGNQSNETQSGFDAASNLKYIDLHNRQLRARFFDATKNTRIC